MKSKNYLRLVKKSYDTLYLLALVHTFVEDKSEELRDYARELLSYLVAFTISKKVTIVSDQRMITRIEALERSVPETGPQPAMA